MPANGGMPFLDRHNEMPACAGMTTYLSRGLAQMFQSKSVSLSRKQESHLF
jgi:hypothetical protein